MVASDEENDLKVAPEHHHEGHHHHKHHNQQDVDLGRCEREREGESWSVRMKEERSRVMSWVSGRKWEIGRAGEMRLREEKEDGEIPCKGKERRVKKVRL